jgi:hypothetical protein
MVVQIELALPIFPPHLHVRALLRVLTCISLDVSLKVTPANRLERIANDGVKTILLPLERFT